MSNFRFLAAIALAAIAQAAGLFATGATHAEAQSQAQERVVIEKAPTSDEFALMLFGAPPPEGIKMRGIVMHSSQSGSPIAATSAALPTTSAPSIVAAPVKFDFNSADVPQDFKPTLESLADALTRPEASGKTLVIAGHTDPMGSAEYNEALSKQRAVAVASFLVERGVPSDRLVTKGFGESDLLSPTNNRLNRRVEFEAR